MRRTCVGDFGDCGSSVRLRCSIIEVSACATTTAAAPGSRSPPAFSRCSSDAYSRRAAASRSRSVSSAREGSMPAAATYAGNAAVASIVARPTKPRDHHDQQPHDQNRQQRHGIQTEQHADQRGRTLAAAEAIPHGIDMTGDHGSRACDREPEPVDRGIGPANGKSGTTAAANQPLPASMRITQSAKPDPGCAEHWCRPDCRCPACGCPRRPAAADDEAADQRAEQVGREAS